MVLWLHATVKPGQHNVNQSAGSRATVRMRLHPRTHNVHPQRACTQQRFQIGAGWSRRALVLYSRALAL